jgi:hypothetical protein
MRVNGEVRIKVVVVGWFKVRVLVAWRRNLRILVVG